MVGRNRLKGVGSEAKVHRVAGLILKIDRESRENSIDGGNLTKSPTAMKAVAALRKLHQRLDLLPRYLSTGSQFFKLFSHSRLFIVVAAGRTAEGLWCAGLRACRGA